MASPSASAPNEHRLYLVAGTTDVDDVIAELGHEPNGVFWEGIVELLVVTEAPALDGRFSTDARSPQAGHPIAVPRGDGTLSEGPLTTGDYALLLGPR